MHIYIYINVGRKNYESITAIINWSELLVVRITADLEANLKPELPQLPSISDNAFMKAYSNQGGDGGSINKSKHKNNDDRRSRSVPIEVIEPSNRNTVGKKKIHFDEDNDDIDANDTVESPMINRIVTKRLIPSQLQRFARTIQAIERERINYRNMIKTELNIKDLPPNISDPDIQPALCKLIRKAVADFPKVAEGIIQHNGLEVDEFNILQLKMSRNLLFKLYVQREINKIEGRKF